MCGRGYGVAVTYAALVKGRGGKGVGAYAAEAGYYGGLCAGVDCACAEVGGLAVKGCCALDLGGLGG